MDEAIEKRWRELSEEVLSGMKEWRLAHPRATFREIEQAVQELLHQLEAQLVQDVALESSQRDWHPLAAASPRCPVCETPLQKRGKQTRKLQGRGGNEIRLERSYGTCPVCRTGLFPLDHELKLLPGSLTPSQHEHLVHLASWMPFARAGQMVKRLLGVRVSEATVRRLTERAGELVEGVQEEESRQAGCVREASEEAGIPEKKLVVSGDGAFVPLLHGEWAEVKMIAIGEVKQASPRAQKRGQQVEVEKLSYFARLAPAPRFADEVLGEMSRRGIPLAKEVAAVSDGAEWLQNLFDLHCKEARRILDFPHAAQRLGSIASEAAQAGHPLATDWVETHCHLLKTEGPRPVLTALQALPASIQALERVQEHRAYLSRRVEMMQYPMYAQLGWPLGSGMVESANKLVMQARLKGSGMHWEPAHVNPMLALRTAVCNDRWEESWQAAWAAWRTQQAQRQKHRALPCLRSLAFTLAWLASHLRPSPPPVRKPLLPPDPPAMLTGTSRPSPYHPWKRAVVPCPRDPAKK